MEANPDPFAAIDWRTLDDAVVREVAGQASAMLASQQDVARSLDQRGTAVAALANAGAAASFAVLAAMLGRETPAWPAAIGGATAMTTFLAGAIYAVQSLRTATVQLPGASPLHFLPLLDGKASWREIVGAEIENHEGYIETNRTALRRRQAALDRAVLAASLAVPFGIWGAAITWAAIWAAGR